MGMLLPWTATRENLLGNEDNFAAIHTDRTPTRTNLAHRQFFSLPHIRPSSRTKTRLRAPGIMLGESVLFSPLLPQSPGGSDPCSASA